MKDIAANVQCAGCGIVTRLNRMYRVAITTADRAKRSSVAKIADDGSWTCPECKHPNNDQESAS